MCSSDSENENHPKQDSVAGEARLQRPVGVQNTCHGCDVREPVQRLPSSSAKTPDHFRTRCRCERHHQEERSEPDVKERMQQIPADCRESLLRGYENMSACRRIQCNYTIEYHIRDGMDGAVEKPEQAQRPPILYERMPTRQPAEWRDRECQTKKSERPESRASDDRVKRRNAEVWQRIPKNERQRTEAQCEDKPLQNWPSYRSPNDSCWEKNGSTFVSKLSPTCPL
jgi:hypothetical protein